MSASSLQLIINTAHREFEQNSPLRRHHSAAAKAGIDFAGLTVRLEAAPFQIIARIRVFPQPVEAAPFQGMLAAAL
jgi:hypothetical protein